MIWAVVPDPNGFRKRRPLVILSEVADLLLDEPFVTVALTTTFSEPPPPNCVKVPWDYRGHPATRLRQRTAAVCDWLPRVRPSEVEAVAGYLPAKVLIRVVERVRALSARGEVPPA